MATDSRKVRELRKALKLTQGQLAEALGVTQGTISKWEKGEHQPDTRLMIKLAEMAGIEDPIIYVFDDTEHDFKTSDLGKDVVVRGAVEVARWVDAPYWDEKDCFDVKIPTTKEWNYFEISGYVVRDDSMGFFYPKGSVVFVAEYELDKLDLEDGDRVIYFRQDDRGLYEITLRRAAFTRQGEIVLSTADDEDGLTQAIRIPRFTKSALRSAPDGYRSFGFLGLLIASFAIENPRRFDPSRPPHEWET